VRAWGEDTLLIIRSQHYRTTESSCGVVFHAL
jgi:hypothetical protein